MNVHVKLYKCRQWHVHMREHIMRIMYVCVYAYVIVRVCVCVAVLCAFFSRRPAWNVSAWYRERQCQYELLVLLSCFIII